MNDTVKRARVDIARPRAYRAWVWAAALRKNNIIYLFPDLILARSDDNDMLEEQFLVSRR